MVTPRIHPDTIEDVKQRADIYDVVSERVVLKRRGKDFVGLCPFHEEKSPSFTVSPSKQMYYCFGCGTGGNAIKFLMEVDKRNFSEVVIDLAGRYQVPIKTEAPEQRQELQRQISLREQLYEIVAIATSFYQHALHQPQGKAALNYLKLDRHLKEETIQHFQLGYAPAGWDSLYGYLVEQKNFPVEIVEKAGLIIPRKTGNGYYDRFRDRLMIPIHDSQGRVIGFGGRTLSDEQPKYLNSPDTELFDKGKTLFALDKAKTPITKADQAIIVEGYFDAIALHAAGIENVVASLGTALSLYQVQLLSRYTESKQIVLNFDADAAGNKAANRAIGEVENLAYKGEIQLRILNLPRGKDPDEFLQQNSAEDYLKLLENSPFWIDWQLQQLLAGKNLETVAQSQPVAQEMVDLLLKIENGIQLTHYLQKCAEILSQGQPTLVPILAKSLQKELNKPRKKEAEISNKTNVIFAVTDRGLLEESETLLLRIYVHCPEYRQTIIDALEARDLDFSLSHHRFLWRQIDQIQKHENIAIINVNLLEKIQDLMWEFPDEIKRVHSILYLDEKAKCSLMRSPLEIRSAIAAMEWVICEKRRKLALQLWKDAHQESQTDLARQYHDQFYSEDEWMRELDRLRHTKFQDLATVPLGDFATQ